MGIRYASPHASRWEDLRYVAEAMALEKIAMAQAEIGDSVLIALACKTNAHRALRCMYETSIC